jgi:hypothetical protein
MSSTAQVELSANRTMASYLRAMHDCELDKAATILAATIDSPVAMAAFIEALAGFALAMMHTAEGLASATGVSLQATTVLDTLTQKLAMASDIDDALGSWLD